MACIDASIFLAWLLPEDLSEQAEALLTHLLRQGITLIAPGLLTAEVSSALRTAVYRRRVTPEDGDEARASFEEIRVNLHDLGPLASSAWSLGKEMNTPNLYDMFYLALAERETCDLWTADKRLIGLLADRFPRARYIGDLA